MIGKIQGIDKEFYNKKCFSEEKNEGNEALETAGKSKNNLRMTMIIKKNVKPSKRSMKLRKRHSLVPQNNQFANKLSQKVNPNSMKMTKKRVASIVAGSASTYKASPDYNLRV